MKDWTRSVSRGLCALLLGAGSAGFTACGSAEGRAGGVGEESARSTAEGSLLVLAASDLRVAFEEVGAAFEQRSGTGVRFAFGSSGNLAAQIRHGAPADLFFSADEGFLDPLVESGRIDPASRHLYAVGRLALVAPPGAVPPRSPEALAESKYELVAIANPEHAPYGAMARKALRAAKVWEEVSGRLVLGEDVAQTYQLVRTGNADAGIVALPLILGAPGPERPYTIIDDRLHPPLRQAAGVLSSSSRPDAAHAFLDFVLSEDGGAILLRHGFESPHAATERVEFNAEEGPRTGTVASGSH